MLQVHPNCFQLTFANGLQVSVAFNARNYCKNRYNEAAPNHCENAEIAVFRGNEHLFADGSYEMDDDGNVLCPQSDTGWKTPDQVAAVIALVASFPSDIAKPEVIRLVHEAVDNLTPA